MCRRRGARPRLLTELLLRMRLALLLPGVTELRLTTRLLPGPAELLLRLLLTELFLLSLLLGLLLAGLLR